MVASKLKLKSQLTRGIMMKSKKKKQIKRKCEYYLASMFPSDECAKRVLKIARELQEKEQEK